MGRVSPVLDVARSLLIVDVKNSVVQAREYRTLDQVDLMGRGKCLAELGVKTVICGAVSIPLKLILESKGVQVIGQICGEINEILDAFLTSNLEHPDLRMPGANTEKEQLQPRKRDGQQSSPGKEHCTRVVITSQGATITSQVDFRFGRAGYLIIVNIETGDVEALNNERNLETPMGAGIQTARVLVEEGVDAVISAHIGPKALQALEMAGIEVFPAIAGTVEAVFQELKPKIVGSRRGRAAQEVPAETMSNPRSR